MITQRQHGTSRIPIEELLRLPSIHQLMQPQGKRTVAHAIADVDHNTGRSFAVRKYMAEHGQPEFPVHVAPANRVLRSYANMDQRVLALPEELGTMWMGNGHRRLAIAVDLGWSHILTTPDVFDSGPEYAHLRGSIPKVFRVTREEAERLYPESTRLGQPWIDWATAQFEAAGLGHLIA